MVDSKAFRYISCKSPNREGIALQSPWDVLGSAISLTPVPGHINNENSVSNVGVRVMVFNTTFDNISIISWRSVLLVEETGVPGENIMFLSDSRY